MTIKLYNAARSSASYRARIVLAFKGLPFEYLPVGLLKGEQNAAAFRALNPSELVPVLDDDGRIVTQSLAIAEYLEERYPQPPLLPHDPLARAFVRSVALSIACDIHPLNNLRVLRYLLRELKASEEQKNAWYRHWVEQGLAQVEARLVAEQRSGRFCHGDQVSLADVTLVPQIFNAKRFDCRLDHVPTIIRIFDACMELPAFEQTRPEKQPDFA